MKLNFFTPVCLFIALGCLLPGQGVHAEIRIGFSSAANAENSGVYVWAREFAKQLEISGMTTTLYPSSTLGSEIVRTEQVLLGLLEVNVTGTQEIELYSELILALDLPFLFRRNLEADALFDFTGFRAEINASTRPAGMRVVDLVSMGGMEGLFTARAPIRTVADVKTFRLRAMSTEQISWVEAWGGSATQVAWEEVPQALQTGIADGYINPPIVAVLFGHGGQLDYFTNLAISPSVRVVVFSEKWFLGLTEKEKATVMAAAGAAREANRTWSARATGYEFSLLAETGIEVIHPDGQQRDSFRQPLLPLYNETMSTEALESAVSYLKEARAYLARHGQGGETQ